MFNIDQTPSFDAQVLLKILGEDDLEQSFGVTFKALPVDQLEPLDLSVGKVVTKFLTNVITDLSDIVDDAGKQLVYSEDLRDRVIQWPHTRTALIRAYMKGYSGSLTGN